MSAAPRARVMRGWGGVHQGRSLVYHPATGEEAAAALRDAAERGLSVAHRGAGNSYGDLAVNEGGALLEMRGLRGIVSFDRERGEVRARAGTTIEELWSETLPAGWWPAVVPGTMKVTLGGAVAVNAHGKNHRSAGSTGDHVTSLDLLEPDGSVRTLAGRDLDRVVGGLGMTGTILDVTLRLQRVHSGLLEVETSTTRSLSETLDELARGADEWPHAVAWIDCFGGAERAGRGVLGFGRDLPPDHAAAGAAMTPREQALPERVLGLVPRRHLWRALRPLLNDRGLGALNVGRYAAARSRRGRRALQPYAQFNFQLDYTPGWVRAYLPHGLLQYQMFVPRAAAAHAFGEALRLQRAAGVVSYLAVMKRHRADPFSASYGLDGYSLALDFPVRPLELDRLIRLFRDFDAVLAEADGTVYAAKDGVSRGRLPRARHPLFSSNLVRRWEGHH